MEQANSKLIEQAFRSYGPLYALRILIIVLTFFLTATPSAVSHSSAYSDHTESKHYQPLSLQFRSIDNKSLNSIGELFAITQDTQGFMWIGGEKGLARYDGYEFKLYRHDITDDHSLSNNRVSGLLVDSYGELWVATAVGVNRYRVISDDFERYSELTDITKYDVNCIFEDSKQNLWFGTSIGLKRFLRSSNEIEDWSLVGKNVKDNEIEKTEPIVGVRDLAEDQSGKLWIGGMSDGIGRLNIETREFIHFVNDPKNENSISSNLISSILVDHENILWAGTFDHGLIRMDIDSLEINRIRFNAGNNLGLSTDKIRSLYEDSQFNLWVGVGDSGLNRFNRKAFKARGDFIFDRYVNLEDDPSSIKHDKVWPIFEDSSGGLWFGHFPAGVSTVNQYAQAFTNFKHNPDVMNSLSHSAILSVAETEEGNLWVGTENGLNHINRANGKVTRKMANHPEDTYNTKGLSASAVTALLVDSDQTLWLGTWLGGLSRFYSNGKQEAVGSFKHSPEIPSDTFGNAIWKIIEGRDGSIWLATTSGLTRYDKNTDKYTHYKFSGDNSNSILRGVVWSVYEDTKGRIWAGTEGGVSRLDRNTGKFYHYQHDELDSNTIGPGNVFSVAEDSEGNFWFGLLGGGLSRLDNKLKNFEHFREKEGVIDEFVVGLQFDNDGYLWFAHGDGISRLDTTTKKFRHFGRQHGIPGNVHNRTAYFKTKNGELVFGSIEGLTIIDTSKLYQNEYIPPLVFTHFSLFNEAIDFNLPDAPLKNSIGAAKEIILRHDQSVFSFEFSALNFRFPELNEYAYKLEGFDQAWTYVGKKRNATYTNLDAGKYTFRIRGSNNEGYWNEEGASIKIVVLPPFWQTWWAYTLYVFAILGLIARFLYLQHRKRMLVVEQNRLLELKVAERTAELRDKNENIQSMLSNIRQGLFTIDASLCVHKDYSRYLESIFERNNLEGVDFEDFLFSCALLSENDKSQICASVRSIVGEPLLNYDFNAHLLLREYEIGVDSDGNSVRKVVELDWNPISENGLVDKLMVTVRDVTKLRQLEGEASKKKRELDVISQVLAISADRFTETMSSIRKLMSSAIAMLEKNLEENIPLTDNDTAFLFRNYHTIKGNARTVNFTFLSDQAHTIENLLSRYRDSVLGDGNDAGETSQSQIRLPNELKELNVCLETILDEYQYVFHDILNRDYQEMHQDFGVNGGIATSVAESMLDKLRSGQHSELESMLLKSQSATLPEVLARVIDALDSIAQQLGKPTPTIDFECSDIRIKHVSSDLIVNSFSHILRNSLDHGIEFPEERFRKQKNERGRIKIKAEIADKNCLSIVVKDDGRGLNVRALRAKGFEAGVWSDTAAPNLEKISELIFSSGVSTKSEVTDISGRGVGMDAVKQFLIEQGGDIALDLLDNNEDEHGFVPFAMVISLPPSMYCHC